MMLLISEIIPWSYGKHEKVVEVVKALSEWNCCQQCIIRFLCIKDHSCFKLSTPTELADWLLFSEDDKKIFVRNIESSSNVVCIACLEILQDRFCNQSFILEVIKSVKNQEYEFDDFFCALTLPVSLLIREHSITIALMEKFPDTFHSLDYKSSFTSIKDAWKWINGPKLAEAFATPFNQKSSFEIQIFFEYKHDDEECSLLTKQTSKDLHRRKKYNRFNRNNMTRLIKELSLEDFKKCLTIPIPPASSGCHCQTIQCSREAIYVAGRYNKYSRTLSQTPWFIEGAKKFEDSVEELICKRVVDRFGGKEHKFSSSGREDVDVRMLGRGRPFFIEVLDPKKMKVTKDELREIEKETNKSTNDVFIRDLQIVDKDETKHLKEGEEVKIKKYRALCMLEGSVSDEKLESINQLVDVQIAQKTPIRVLHRRPLATRMRTVHEMSVTRLNQQLFVLSLATQAGTYIKEFVHGDFKRTQPSLGDLLGCECDILKLDVDDVMLDWPPVIDYHDK